MFDKIVKIARRTVVVAPGELDLLFDVAELVLQIQEVGVGLKVRIGLGYREQIGQ